MKFIEFFVRTQESRTKKTSWKLHASYRQACKAQMIKKYYEVIAKKQNIVSRPKIGRPKATQEIQF